MQADAILWDYDGTLVNSVPKNIEITKQILARVAPRLAEENLPSYLKSEATYHVANHQAKNWQDLYVNFYGLTEKEMLEAGTLWTEYQLKNTTPVKLFPGIKQTIMQINLPQGVCSQNSSENINRVLKVNNISRKFHSVVGYDDIPENEQKPFPFAGLRCLEQIFDNTSGKIVYYIGDHEGDVEFARNIGKAFNGRSKIFSIVVKYSGADPSQWDYKPDFEIQKPQELLKIINGQSF